MRTITTLCAAALCTLASPLILNAHPFDPQDSPIVIADGSSRPGPGGKKDEEKKKKDTTNRARVVLRNIKHDDHFLPIPPAVFYASDPTTSTNHPACFEMLHDTVACKSATGNQACDKYYVDLPQNQSWTLKFNDTGSFKWQTGEPHQVQINTGNSTLNSYPASPTRLEDVSYPLHSATLMIGNDTVGTTYPLAGQTFPGYLTFVIHYCNGSSCRQKDGSDHCKDKP